MFLMPFYMVFCKKKCTWHSLLAIEIIQGLIMCVFFIRQFMVLSKPQALGLIALPLSCSILGFMFLGLIVTCLSSFTLLVWFIFFSMLIIPSLLAAILPLFQILFIRAFALKDLGPLSYFLGLQFEYTLTGIFDHQSKYAKDLLIKFNMLDCKPCSNLGLST